MKYHFLIYLILLSLSFETYSQNSDFNYGIKIGTNFSEYTPDFKVNNTSLQSEFSGKIGYYFGGYANFGLNNRLRLQSELLLSNNGTNVKYDVIVAPPGSFPGEVAVMREYEYNLNEFNLSIPISLKYNFNDSFYAEAGIMLNYVLFIKQQIKNSPFEDWNPFDNPEENIERLDLAGLLGLGYKLSKKINLNLRYSLSLIERNSSAFHNDNIALPEIVPIDYVRSSIFYLGVEYNLSALKKNNN